MDRNLCSMFTARRFRKYDRPLDNITGWAVSHKFNVDLVERLDAFMSTLAKEEPIRVVTSSAPGCVVISSSAPGCVSSARAYVPDNDEGGSCTENPFAGRTRKTPTRCADYTAIIDRAIGTNVCDIVDAALHVSYAVQNNLIVYNF